MVCYCCCWFVGCLFLELGLLVGNGGKGGDRNWGIVGERGEWWLLMLGGGYELWRRIDCLICLVFFYYIRCVNCIPINLNRSILKRSVHYDICRGYIGGYFGGDFIGDYFGVSGWWDRVLADVVVLVRWVWRFFSNSSIDRVWRKDTKEVWRVMIFIKVL